MSRYALLRSELAAQPRRWVITGVAGFIGSHLLETLLSLDQEVVGLDNFVSGARGNLEDVRSRVNGGQWARFALHEGSVADLGICQKVCVGADYVLHQAGFVSVPRSLENPLECHETNVTGTLQMLLAAREARVRKVVYASSSAVYGDDPGLPKTESMIGPPLSPYGASKWMAEIYAQLFQAQFGVGAIGLRYFNIFGPRQDPSGGYAAVIPRWIGKLIRGEECMIHGDGKSTRDFCPVADVVQANLLAATSEGLEVKVFNAGLGRSTNLVQLYGLLSEAAVSLGLPGPRPVVHGPVRAGDIEHSVADVSAGRKWLGFEPSLELGPAMRETMGWYAGREGR
jgi:UDP-N-acetylglucosamine 4-epimerase